MDIFWTKKRVNQGPAVPTYAMAYDSNNMVFIHVATRLIEIAIFLYCQWQRIFVCD